MKQLLRILSLVLLAALPFSQLARTAGAQTIVQRPAVAFVTSERNAIYVAKPDGTIDSIFHNIPGILTASSLAVLGSDPGGNTFLLGGSFYYLDLSSSQYVRYNGLIAFPKNFDPTRGTSQIKFLKRAMIDSAAFRPVAALTADGNEWFATMLSSTTGNIPVYFYHGRMDKNETDPGYSIDSAGPTGQSALEGGYHLSNISVTPDGKMLATSVDHLSSDNLTRFQLYVWRIHDFPPAISIIDYSSKVKGLGLRANPDSNFAFAIRATSNTRADIGLADLGSQADNSIQFFDTPIDGNNVDLTHPSRSIPRSAIPSDMNFFSGSRGTLPNGKPYNEVDAYAQQYGAGGDINFSMSGDSAVFITHEAPDDISKRFAKSAVYIYDFNSGTATLVYNNPAALELQPVFVTMPYTIPQPEGSLSVSTTSLAFGTIDTGSTATKTALLTNGGATGAKSITIDSIKITGAYASNYSWTGTTVPTSIAVTDAGVTLTFTYTPTAPAIQQNAAAHIYWNGGSTPTNISLTGTSKVKPPQSVARDEARASIAVSPNPFAADLTVNVTPEEAGKVEVKMFDLLGHERFSNVRTVARGELSSFAIDAHSIGLTAGTYYVSITLNGQTSIRQVVLQ